MARLRRKLLLAAGTFVLAAAGAAISVLPAHADTIIQLNFNNVTGSTFLAKPKLTTAIPTFPVTGQLDLNTGQMTAQAKIPNITASMSLLGFVKATATIAVVPSGPLTGTVDLAKGTISTTTTFTVDILNVHLDATPGINLVSSGCRTRQTTTTTMTNTTPLSLTNGTTVSGSFTLPPFTHCGLTTPLLTQLMSGPGNTMTLTLK